MGATVPIPVERGLFFSSPRCNQCNFPSVHSGGERAAGLLREYAGRWRRVLTDPQVTRRRTGPLAWSPLEHGCHVRDMCLLFHQRLDATLGTASSAPAPGEQGGSPDVPGLYRDEDPRRVAGELGRAAESLARRFASLSAGDWDRADPRFTDPRLTVAFFTGHFLHDIVHDLGEVTRAGRGRGADTGPRGTGPGHGTPGAAEVPS
ncbi:DinB family protein [Streptomyces sp. NPDC004609]|uniref:DinB family protein n=1 Tax=Streptomyces sp. NPDC004609 TaxID=3364704 RepID=UPI0036BFF79A